MRLLFILLFTSLVNCAAGQAIPEITESINLPTDEAGHVRFQEVQRISDSTASANDVVKRARTWAAKAYNNSEKVVQQYDPAAGMLVIKGLMAVPLVLKTRVLGVVTTTEEHLVDYVLTIEGKQGRYRTTLDNFIIRPSSSTLVPTYEARPLPTRSQTEAELREQYGKGSKTAASVAAQTQQQTILSIQEQVRKLLKSLNEGINVKEKDW